MATNIAKIVNDTFASTTGLVAHFHLAFSFPAKTRTRNGRKLDFMTQKCRLRTKTAKNETEPVTLRPRFVFGFFFSPFVTATFWDCSVLCQVSPGWLHCVFEMAVEYKCMQLCMSNDSIVNNFYMIFIVLAVLRFSK